jgi:O-antigen ligase
VLACRQARDMTSLIQQRKAIGRTRLLGVIFVCVGAAGLVLFALVFSLDLSRVPVLGSVAAGSVAIGGAGVGNLINYRRRLSAFEREHGHGAGQPSAR